MKNNKLLLAASLLAASSLATASYTELQLYQTGNATLSSAGACKLKRIKFPDAKHGVFFDETTQESFEGVVSSDGKLLARFGVQNFMLSDISSSTARQDYLRQVNSYSLHPDSLNYFVEQNNCTFMDDVSNTPIIQTNPAQNAVKLSTAKLRPKTNDWTINHQAVMSISFHATTLKETNCSSAINCTRTGVVSNMNFSFRHKSKAVSSDRLLSLD